MPASKLFSLTPAGNQALKHRVVLALLARYHTTANHVPSDLQVDYYRQRAGNGGGLLITEATLISPVAGGYHGSPAIFSQKRIEGWKRTATINTCMHFLQVTDAVHAQGAVIFQQLWHASQASNKALLPDNASPVSASAIAVVGVSESLFGEPYGIPLEENEIPADIQGFVTATSSIGIGGCTRNRGIYRT